MTGLFHSRMIGLTIGLFVGNAFAFSTRKQVSWMVESDGGLSPIQ